MLNAFVLISNELDDDLAIKLFDAIMQIEEGHVPSEKEANLSLSEHFY